MQMRYTFWFGLAVFGLIVALGAQVAFFVLSSGRP